MELFSKTDEDCDANTDPESAGQSDIITNFIANSLGSPLEIDMPHVLRAGVESERDLYLESAVFPDDVADDEETAEVLNDLRSLCEVFGDLSAVWIEKIRHVPSVTVKSELPCSTGIPIDQAAESSSPWVFIEYDTVRDAAVAAVALNGLCVGGEALVVRMYSYSAYVAGKCSDKYCWGSENLSSLNLDDAGTVAERGTSEGAVIAVRNYVTSDDLESSSGDSEELGAIKRDLIDLTAAQGGNESPFIRRVTIMADLGDTEDADTASDETVLGSARLAACVRYSSLAAATTAMLSLDGTLLGGSRLKAWVKRSSTVPQTISLHALASLSVKEELLEDVVVNSGCNHGSSVTANEIIALRNIVRSPTSSETAIAAPLKAGSSLEGADPGTIPTPVGPKRTTANNKEEVVEEVKLPLQSVYKEATLAPKLEKNGAPDSKHRIKVLQSDCMCISALVWHSSSSPSSLCGILSDAYERITYIPSPLIITSQVAEEDIDACVKEFLSSIATFQEKMKVRAAVQSSTDAALIG